MPQIIDRNFRGIVLMVLSMAFFAIADVFIKLVSGALSPAHTSLMLVLGGAVVFVVVTKAQGGAVMARSAVSRVMLIRYAAEALATFSVVMALASVPLSTLGAIIQATPLVSVAGAVLFLGERVSWRRWIAIWIGFAGVLLIVRPGAAGFDAAVLWAVVAMVGLSARDLTSRALPGDLSTTQVASLTMLAVVPIAAIWCVAVYGTVIPTDANWWLVLAMTASAAAGYFLITASVRMAEMSVVSPFRYTRLIFLLILGVAVFAERPDAMTLGGAALIIASGIYSMWRDRVAKRQNALR